MRRLPLPEPGEPDSRSAVRYLLWIARKQIDLILCGVLLGIVWMVSQALVPAALGAGIDALAAHDRQRLLWSGGALLGLGALIAVSGIMRHRFAVLRRCTPRPVLHLGRSTSRRWVTISGHSRLPGRS